MLLASAAACRRASGWVSESIVLAGVDFVKALRERSSRGNLLLVDGDSIHVPARQQTREVRGKVNVPTALVAAAKGLRAYVDAAGGKTALGNPRAACVIEPNGKIGSRKRLLWLITLDAGDSRSACAVAGCARVAGAIQRRADPDEARSLPKPGSRTARTVRRRIDRSPLAERSRT